MTDQNTKAETVTASDEPLVSRWRSVIDDPPQLNESVLVLDSENRAAIAYRTDHNGGGFVSGSLHGTAPAWWCRIPERPDSDRVDTKVDKELGPLRRMIEECDQWNVMTMTTGQTTSVLFNVRMPPCD